jgi:Tfp pilus assembly protein PilN
MLKINFAPDDYIQKKQSLRINRLCLVLFLLFMSALVGMFSLIKLRQRAILSQVTLVNRQMLEASESIQQLEELQTKRKKMMKAALITAELIEPVPRSVVVASLTNNLPAGVSLTKLKLVQKEQKRTANTNNYSSKFEAKKADIDADVSIAAIEQCNETRIELEGIAPSNIQVAGYIERLSSSVLFENVALVHSKERTISHEKFLEFKLTAMLSQKAELTRSNIVSMKQEGSNL